MGKGISGYDIACFEDLTIEQCKRECEADNTCITVDYRKSTNTCCTQEVTAEEVGASFVDSSVWDYYELISCGKFSL